MVKHATFIEYGEIAGTALTGSYQTIAYPSDDLAIIYIFNSCDEPIIISLDGGVTDHFKLDGEGWSFDARTNSKHIKRANYQVKHAGAVPATGTVRISGVMA